MQGSFEKQVQAKLDELKITPSAPVWAKVERQIQPEKKRRRAFYWILFLMLLVAGGAFYFSSRHYPGPAGRKSVTNGNVAVDYKTPLKHKSSSVLNVPGEQNDETKTVRILTNNPVAAQVVTGERVNPTFTGVKMYSSANIKRVTIQVKATGLSTGKTVVIPAHPELPAVSEIARQQPMPGKKDLDFAEKKESVFDTLFTESLLTRRDSASQEKKNETNELPLKADTVSVKRKVARLESKWRKTVVLQAGWNRRATGLFSSAAADYYASPTTGTSNSPQTGYSTSGTGQVKGGSSLTIGAGFTRIISPHVAVSFGLQYTFHRLHSQVGTFRRSDTAFALGARTTAVQGYYRNGSSTDYNINQHLVEIPVSFSYKPVATLPVSLSVGASYGRLLQSNLLTYNSISNSYYYTADNNTKNHFSLLSSLQVSLFSRSGFQVSAGPVVQYQLTPMQQQTTATPMRLSFAGIRTNITF